MPTPPMMPSPGGKQIQISKDQFLNIIATQLVASQVQLKGMMFVKTLPDYEEVVSNFIGEPSRKYGLRHIKNEHKVIFDLWVPVESGEPQHREMVATYDELFGILIQHQCQTPPQLADVVYDMIGSRTAKEWDDLINKISKPKIII